MVFSIVFNLSATISISRPTSSFSIETSFCKPP
jgi:hypothetical protein